MPDEMQPPSSLATSVGNMPIVAPREPPLPISVIKGKRLLMIDPNPALLRVFGGVLADLGAEMTYATSTAEARQHVMAIRFDAVLMSPDPAAVLFLNSLDESQSQSAPVVLVGSGHEQSVLTSMRVVAAVSKPVLQGKLIEAVARTLSGNRKRRPSPENLPDAREAKRHYRRIGVLVVEDNAVNAKVTTMQLEKLNCRVAVAGNGLEALRVLEDSPRAFELVLMDCQMPEMDGFDCTREIRRREAGTGRHLPIVALTANVMSDVSEACLSAGMDSYISKPVRIAEINESLRRFVPNYTSDSEYESPDRSHPSSGSSTPAAHGEHHAARSPSSGDSPPSSSAAVQSTTVVPKHGDDAGPSS